MKAIYGALMLFLAVFAIWETELADKYRLQVQQLKQECAYTENDRREWRETAYRTMDTLHETVNQSSTNYQALFDQFVEQRKELQDLRQQYEAVRPRIPK